MRNALKILAILAVVGLLVGGVSLFSVYEATQQVPEFYRTALARAAEDQHADRDEFVAQAMALASDLRRSGHWQTLFTDAQVNAWLALELVNNYPELLPVDLHDPRVTIQDKEVTIACRYTNGGVTSILSLTLDVFVKDPHVLALRVRHARAGAVPVPLARVLDAISHTAAQLNLRLEWRKAHGDPVALITFPKPRDGQADAIMLHAIELRNGELFASGTIGPGRHGPSASAGPVPMGDATAGSQSRIGAATKETRQE